MSQVLNNSWEQYTGLYQLMLKSTKQVQTIQNLLNSLKGSIEQFSSSIQNIAENFHKQISQDTNESDILVSYYQFVSNYLLKLSQTQNEAAKNIYTEVIEPFDLFVGNYRQNNRQTAKQGKALLTKLEDTRGDVQRTQEDYYKLARVAEKTGEQIERTISQIDQGIRSQEDLQKVSDKSVKLKIIAEESEQQYRSKIEVCNIIWEDYDKEFKELFSIFDYNDESRISFTRQTISNLAKQMQQMSNQQTTDHQDFQTKIEDLDTKLSENQEKKIDTFSKLLNGKKLESFQSNKEEFLSYENYKQKQMEYIEEDFIMIGGPTLKESDRQKLNQIIEELISDKNEQIIQLKQKPSNGEKSASQTNISASIEDNKQIQKVSSENIKDQQQQIQQKDSKEEQKKQVIFNNSKFLTEILKNKNGRQNFLETCSEEKFAQLEIIMKKIIEGIKSDEIFNPEQFYLVLQISSRVLKNPSAKKQKENQSNYQNFREFLARKINEDQIFIQEDKWQQLYEFISNKKIDEKIKIHKQIEQQQTGIIKGNVKKGFNIVSKGLGLGLGALGIGKQSKDQIEDQKLIKEEEKSEINYLILQEINKILLNLELNTEFSTNLIINIATQKGISNRHISSLVAKQEDKKNNDIRREYYSYKKIFVKKNARTKELSQDKIKKILFCVQLSLQFLGAEDKPWQLLLVSKKFKKQLDKKIFKMFLLRDYKQNQFLRNNRISIYKAWLQTYMFSLDYEKIKIDMKSGQNPYEKQERIEEIIDLDVLRSLHIHQEEISNETLQNLLKAFAYSNRGISYCQGMNYIAGYLYLIIKDETETYKQFHVIMNMYFQDLFTNQFERLKIMFYQLTRCLSIFLPKLSEHFKQENIEPDYYATGWFITIFTSVFQYTLESHVLQVVWDIFVIEGWKGFFKCVLWILKTHEQKLLEMKFDDLLHYLGEMIKTQFFGLNEQQLKEKGIIVNIDSIKQDINKFHITNKFLDNIEKEYECFQVNLKKKLKERSQIKSQQNQQQQLKN
ncbi:Rab-GTPase-TBC domain [Pseudocohnilembus persalinus]|uniref:Rab-GTPase-TBC domain n=1 Tax=Pseudocohnilembus persalinus TaxID=266149 RepID=A0A0V0QGK6_PSEPJ|nr:Rab-GTPase-TBC domain [Pseudocohnilembus persalinus]|eukprot:KRX01411.1 Rab-GTPase-TBC domain [Pseudocohnilembus persalinus]